MENNKRNRKPMTKKEKTIYGAAFAAIAALLVAGIFVMVQENTYIPERPYETPPAVTAPPVTPTPTPVPATPAPSAKPGPAAKPTPTPQPTLYIPPRPVKIYFTSLEITTEVMPVGINIEGEMATIDDAHIAGWYYNPNNPVSPGEKGNAIIAGHVRWKGKVGDFSKIGELTDKDDVVIEFDKGYTRTFRAVSNDIFPLNDYPDWVMKENSEDARVTLITCAGEFNHEIGTSENRNVVVLKEVNS